MTNEEFFNAHMGERVIYKGKDIGAYVAGYVGEKYIILGFHDYTGCILRFTSRVNKMLNGVYTSYRFAKLKYVEVVNKSAEKVSNMAEKKILTIHLTDEWYQKIASGEKTEEYRECSVYWTIRLLRKDIPNRPNVIAGVAKYHRASDRGLFVQGYLTGGLKHTSDSPEDRTYRKEVLEPFTHVHFLLGYPKDNQPYIEKEIDEITVDKPKKGMCPDAWLKKNMFVIRFK